MSCSYKVGDTVKFGGKCYLVVNKQLLGTEWLLTLRTAGGSDFQINCGDASDCAAKGRQRAIRLFENEARERGSTQVTCQFEIGGTAKFEGRCYTVVDKQRLGTEWLLLLKSSSTGTPFQINCRDATNCAERS